jgi:hypothetical protein
MEQGPPQNIGGSASGRSEAELRISECGLRSADLSIVGEDGADHEAM